MPVASGAECGGEWNAAATPSLQSGNVQTTIGRGTIRRAGGLAAQVRVGDPVSQGDVIETAADGRIRIRFVDGATFDISGDTRMVLCESCFNSDGNSYAALFDLTRGTFAFIGGQLIRTGGLGGDTPVAGIRDRARAGGFGLLSLTALTFSMMSDVQASDPNATFLDDDNLTYKDLEHGVFELVTKEVPPRHIIVEDPGETVLLNRTGSGISVSQVGNSAARMEELQAVQRDVLANYARGFGTTGSGTPPLVQPSLLQPINFIQTDAPATQNALQPLQTFIAPAPDIMIVRPPPTLNAASGPTEFDTVLFDTFTATSGTLTATSSDSDAILTFGIGGGTAGSTMLDGVSYDQAKTGQYGTLYLNSLTGAYTFDPNSAAINALKAPTTESFAITASDGFLSTSETFTITINGTNDAAVLSGTATGSVGESAGTAFAANAAPAVTGRLTATDVDDPSNTFTAVGIPTRTTGGHGTFTMTTDGVWTYTLDNGDGAVQALNVGDTLTDTFTVTTLDGTAQLVKITIHGTNDAAVISGTTTGSVIEAGASTPGVSKATGTLTAADVDNASNTFVAVNSPTKSDAGYGAFTMTAAGVWTYTLDNTHCMVQSLDDGDTLTDTFTVTSIDGTTQLLTVTIAGANDADPNDFDYLATGTHVRFASPYVYGTPKEDTIAGGGDCGQIVYGGAGSDTICGGGKSDIIYGGSGDDTIRGNKGDDTIYGGSGNDTITGNHGCDTIIGGYGADFLAGGNGNDSFVFLSVADSRAGRSDTILDFKSGLDRIDLTAFGALGFVILALSSTSTSVPAHTIAWLYDSTANETIVYVNPTDKTLSIGASELLEVHLQGIATVHASDFDFAPTTAVAVVAGDPHDPGAAAQHDAAIVTKTSADGLSDTSVGDGLPPAGTGGAVRTADAGQGVDFARAAVEPDRSAKDPGFHEDRPSPEYAIDDEANTPTDQLASERPHVHVAEQVETRFTFDRIQTFDNTDTTTSGHEAATDWRSAIHSNGTAARNADHDRLEMRIETGAIVMAGDRDHMESMKSRGMTIADDGHGARGHGESFHFADAIFGFDRLVAVEIEPPARAYASIRIGMHSGGAHEIGSHPSQQQSPDYFAFHVLHDLIA